MHRRGLGRHGGTTAQWLRGVVLALCLVPPPAHAQVAARPLSKTASGRQGAVATGSPFATEAALGVLARGGNAIDAAAAAHFALLVTDPANSSVGGRVQMLIVLRDGRHVAIDGMTEAPAGVPPLAADSAGRARDDRSGYKLVPVPGNLAAEIEMVGKYGTMTLADVLQPAIALAENGFAVPRNIALAWKASRDALSRDPGAAMHFLKPDGAAYAAGERFRQPVLAGLLRQIAQSGAKSFYDGANAETIVGDVQRAGGFIRREDLRDYRARPGVVVETTYRGYQVVSAGGRAWGNTLTEMLNILGHFPVSRREPTREEIERLARIIAQAEADRPQEIGTLKPKPDGLSLEQLSSPTFAAQRAALIRTRMAQGTTPGRAGGTGGVVPDDTDGPFDTTHLSVMDAAGNAVALTTSIGPHFGARVASPELGFLYGYSYRMRSDPSPNARDETEMTPTIVLRGGRPVLVIGGAGSERIPSAIVQVISNVIDRGWTLKRAMTAPRIFCLDDRLRMQPGFPAAMADALRARGFQVELANDPLRHLGLVHAVQYDAASKMYFGAADAGWDGTAGAPPKRD